MKFPTFDNPKENEQVLCVHRKDLETYFHRQMENEFWPADDLRAVLLDQLWIPRGVCEKDPSYKQLIPYVSLRYLRNTPTLFALLSRSSKGGEGRLFGKSTIGLAGHINPEDGSLNNLATIEAAIQRELKEEVSKICTRSPDPEFCGYVNNEDDEVGKVHLGLVFSVDISVLNFFPVEDSLVNPSFATYDQLQRNNNLERWSQLIVESAHRPLLKA